MADTKKQYRFLTAKKIKPSDDAFHGSHSLFNLEWWYFDAVFDNGYSVHIGFRVNHVKEIGVLQTRINIYKDGVAIVNVTNHNMLSKWSISKECPKILIDNECVMKLYEDHYQKTGQSLYKIKMSIKNHAVDLTFMGTTPGWKIETKETCWTVAQPKAKVAGTIYRLRY